MLFPGTRPASGGSSLLANGDSLLFPTGAGTNLTLSAPSGADQKITLPPDGGANGEFLTTDGTGVTSWAAIPGGVSTFLGLTDTPVSYAGSAGFLARVEPGGSPNEIVFTDGLTLFEAVGAVSAHEGAANPHPQYLRPGVDAYVETFNGRSGTVVPIAADYDAFFLTPAEGDAAYAPLSHVGSNGIAQHAAFTSSLAGFAPASGGGTTNFLRADGTWAAPPGGGGGDMSTATYDPAGIAEQLVGLTATQTLSNKTLAEPKSTMPVGAGDGTYTGLVQAGTAGSALGFGDLIYYRTSDSKWVLADASAAGTAGDVALAICVEAAAGDGNSTTALLCGKVRADAAFPTLPVGGAVYASEAAGDITGTIPTTTDAVIRRLGFAEDANTLWFMPSPDYITHV